MGGSYAQVGKPGVKGTGTPEGVPRTAAITKLPTQKAVNDEGALLRNSSGYQARSLNVQ
jgi:hypothetical protein